ncbi:MAG: sigma-54 dependent transcriptional regulator, partial [Pygmaiobacter sp.]
MKYKVLVIDDEFLIRVSLEDGLSDLGYQVETAETIQDGLALIESFRPDAVLLDNCLGKDIGTEYIETIKKIDEDIQIIVVTAYGTVAQAVGAIRSGAYDFIQKPFDLDELDILIRRSLDQLKKNRSLELLKGKPRELIGDSPATQQIRQQILLLAKNDNVDLLIRGETGTGKEVVVNMIHSLSSRSDEPLVKINCSAIPDTLLEAELFGYEKGAFTGAAKTKKGLLELANDGTVFLDELGEMPLAMQAKLLTFLEDRCFKRVGGLADIEVNVRIIAATNRRLEEEIVKGNFREDLFYRLNVMQIMIPPLRERREDIPVLCEFYLEYFNQKFSKNIHTIAPDCMRDMLNYYWKGNVRELRNVLERAVLFCEEDVLSHIELYPAAAHGVAMGTSGLRDLTRGAINLEKELATIERAYIDQAMTLCDGNY